jgi:hypothetical protein
MLTLSALPGTCAGSPADLRFYHENVVFPFLMGFLYCDQNKSSSMNALRESLIDGDARQNRRRRLQNDKSEKEQVAGCDERSA